MSFILLQIDFNQQQTKNIRLKGKMNMQCRFRKMNKYIVLYVHEIKMTCIDMHIESLLCFSRRKSHQYKK